MMSKCKMSQWVETSEVVEARGINYLFTALNHEAASLPQTDFTLPDQTGFTLSDPEVIHQSGADQASEKLSEVNILNYAFIRLYVEALNQEPRDFLYTLTDTVYPTTDFMYILALYCQYCNRPFTSIEDSFQHSTSCSKIKCYEEKSLKSWQYSMRAETDLIDGLQNMTWNSRSYECKELENMKSFGFNSLSNENSDHQTDINSNNYFPEYLYRSTKYSFDENSDMNESYFHLPLNDYTNFNAVHHAENYTQMLSPCNNYTLLNHWDSPKTYKTMQKYMINRKIKDSISLEAVKPYNVNTEIIINDMSYSQEDPEYYEFIKDMYFGMSEKIEDSSDISDNSDVRQIYSASHENKGKIVMKTSKTFVINKLQLLNKIETDKCTFKRTKDNKQNKEQLKYIRNSNTTFEKRTRKNYNSKYKKQKKSHDAIEENNKSCVNTTKILNKSNILPYGLDISQGEHFKGQENKKCIRIVRSGSSKVCGKQADIVKKTKTKKKVNCSKMPVKEKISKTLVRPKNRKSENNDKKHLKGKENQTCWKIVKSRSSKVCVKQGTTVKKTKPRNKIFFSKMPVKEKISKALVHQKNQKSENSYNTAKILKNNPKKVLKRPYKYFGSTKLAKSCLQLKRAPFRCNSCGVLSNNDKSLEEHLWVIHGKRKIQN